MSRYREERGTPLTFRERAAKENARIDELVKMLEQEKKKQKDYREALDKLWERSDELHKKIFLSINRDRRLLEHLQKCFTAEGGGIFYLLQQLGVCCFNMNDFREEDRENRRRYLLEQLARTSAAVQAAFAAYSEDDGTEWENVLLRPDKKGQNSKIITEYIDILLRSAEEELKGIGQQTVQKRKLDFYCRLWYGTELLLKEAASEEGRKKTMEETAGWYRRMKRLLEEYGVKILFYGEADAAQRMEYFNTEYDGEHMPAVISAQTCGNETFAPLYGTYHLDQEEQCDERA